MLFADCGRITDKREVIPRLELPTIREFSGSVAYPARGTRHPARASSPVSPRSFPAEFCRPVRDDVEGQCSGGLRGTTATSFAVFRFDIEQRAQAAAPVT